MPKFVKLPFSSLSFPDARNFYEVNPEHVVLIQADGFFSNIWFTFGGPWRCMVSSDTVKKILDGKVRLAEDDDDD